MSLTEGDCVYYTPNGPDDIGAVIEVYDDNSAKVMFPDETDIFMDSTLTKVS
jgi:hypothetical protein